MRRIMAETEIAKNLKFVIDRLTLASKSRTEELKCLCPLPRLVAVSKTKPKELIVAAYKHGQINFGENYVPELIEKSNNEQILKECPNIKWHMIGHLQSNKVNKVLDIPNLNVIETVDSVKLAALIDRTWGALHKDHPLNVFVQVNTSQEPSKSGVSPEQVSGLVGFIRSSCSNLKFIGLMTIGAFDYDLTNGPNPDFECLMKCRTDICATLQLPIAEVELSMGMSSDFEHAIHVGSTNIRVGSTIFGSREYSN